jgi:hypothetical protein
VILALGGINEIDLRWSHKRRMRLSHGIVRHQAGGRGRKVCVTTISFFNEAQYWSDGPTGFSTALFRCERCGVSMEVAASTLRFVTTATSTAHRMKRRLRVIL